MPVAPKVNPPLRTLLGPGPSPVNPRVLESLALPVVGHLDPAFLKIMDESMAMLRSSASMGCSARAWSTWRSAAAQMLIRWKRSGGRLWIQDNSALGLPP